MSAARPGDGRGGGAAAGGEQRERGVLRRSLAQRHLVVYGLLFIAPMAPVGVFGALDARSRGVVPLVYAVATAAMAFTAYSYARMLRVVPQAGSVYAYARAGLGKGADFVAGWMLLLDYLLIPAVGFLFSGIAMHQLVPEVDQWVWTAAAVLVTTALNLSGARRAATVGFLVLAVELVALAVFVAAALVVLVQEGPQRSWAAPFTGDRGLTAGAVLGAVSVAVLSFLGFDAIAGFAEETVRAPDSGRGVPRGRTATGADGARRRTVAAPLARAVRRLRHPARAARPGRAMLACLLVAGVLFVAQTYLAVLLTEDSSRELARHPEQQGPAFYVAVQTSIGGWLQTTVAASKALGAAFAALAGEAAAGRLLYAMARDRRLPVPLARVDRGSGVPRRTVLLAGAVTLAAAVWAARTADGLDRLVSLVNVGALTAFALLHLSVIGYYGVRWRRGRPSQERYAEVAAEGGSPALRVLRDWVMPLAGLAVTLAVIVTAHREAQFAGLVWLGVALLVLAVRRLAAR